MEEFYANNRKRRRLAYALRRRKSSNGFKGAWDRISNDVSVGVIPLWCLTNVRSMRVPMTQKKRVAETPATFDFYVPVCAAVHLR